MARVTGLGGVFFKVEDPQRLKQWYELHLGLHCHEDGGMVFEWREAQAPEKTGLTVVAPFPQATHYFGKAEQQFMLNLRVDDLEALLAQLREEGVTVDERTESNAYGRFAWIIDPEGRRVELWEPKPEPVSAAQEVEVSASEAQAAPAQHLGTKPKRTRAATSKQPVQRTRRKTRQR